MSLVRLIILTTALYLAAATDSFPQNDQTDERSVDGNSANGSLKESTTDETSKQEPKQPTSDKIKRDLPIVGPIPSQYHGQATGQTTFDGVAASDFELPGIDSDEASSEEIDRVRGNKRPGQFQPHRPSSANTNRGPLAFPKKKRQSFEFNHQHRNDDVFDTRAPNFGVSLDLTLPSTISPFHDVYTNDDWYDNQQLPRLSINDESFGQMETPQQRLERIQADYAQTLAEYRVSLIKFQEELKKYSAINGDKR